MNELITNVKALYEETLNNLKSSKANNTIRAYKSDFKDFESGWRQTCYCRRSRYMIIIILPISQATITQELFLTALVPPDKS